MSSITVRRRRASAFTLIELLVVIAIIAILAAILFPVFAQARQSARGASSQSNLRQLSLGVLMYSQDYDEAFPMFQTWYSPTAGNVSWGSAHNWSMWTFDIAPYLKNAQIFGDPLYGPSSRSAFDISVFPDYGYNTTTLSPTFINTSPWQYPGEADSSINFPSTTVMFSGIADNVETQGSWWYGDGTLFDLGNAEPPDCSNIPAECFSDWAPDKNDSFLPNEAAGLYTGGDSVRKTNAMNFSFVDGHCKFMQEGQGAVGTDWHHGSLSGTIHVLDNNKYMWQVMQQ